MSVIVDPKAEAGALLQAALAGEVPKLQATFAAIVRESFTSHPMRHVTQAEVRRRGEILVRWFRILRGDKGWPLDRVLSSLRAALVAALDGRTYEPSDSVMYRPDEGIEPVAAALRSERLMRGPEAALS